MRWTLRDLLLLLLAAGLLLGYGAAATRSAQEASVIIACGDHLRRIGNALSFYQDDNHDQFPRTRYVPGAPVVAYTGVASADPFGPAGPRANDVTAPAYLLARETLLPAEVFTCPAAYRHGLAEVADFTDQTVRQASNFDARIHYSYALANPYPGTAAEAAGYNLNRRRRVLPPLFAVASDTNPGANDQPPTTQSLDRETVRLANSPNHQRDGQNVLRADGSVEFYLSPFVGVDFDNIYASQATFPQPKGANDAVLLPTWSDGPDEVPSALYWRRVVFVAASILTTAGLLYIIIRSVRRSRSEPAGESWYLG